ncbi:MAG: DUF2508 family protein [Clostridia bacterium]|nr:DUF2508 family protein [Clostridia bacterium]MBQ2939971.1 DUF2508 family protein [Clostridia bacterium]
MFFSRLKEQLVREPAADTAIEDALFEVREQMALVRSRFAWERDSDLIEACIYEMEALDARQRYLLGLARSQDLRAVRLRCLSGEGVK